MSGRKLIFTNDLFVCANDIYTSILRVLPGKYDSPRFPSHNCVWSVDLSCGLICNMCFLPYSSFPVCVCVLCFTITLLPCCLRTHPYPFPSFPYSLHSFPLSNIQPFTGLVFISICPFPTCFKRLSLSLSLSFSLSLHANVKTRLQSNPLCP